MINLGNIRSQNDGVMSQLKKKIVLKTKLYIFNIFNVTMYAPVYGLIDDGTEV